jgi:aminoglycoside phosphotransferase (APT) family kinase protein
VQASVRNLERMLFTHRGYNMPDVMVHGDLWCNNVLLPKATDGKAQFADSIAAVIDWQVHTFDSQLQFR